MPGKNTIKFINSLKQKKFRRQHRLFIIEGEKMVDELIGSGFGVHSVYATKEWLHDHRQEVKVRAEEFPLYEIREQELSRISSLKAPNKVLAVVHFPHWDLSAFKLSAGLSLVLDDIRDPGNLGTLIRSAHWFGIVNIILSPDSAEVTSPKVVQSAMGSVLHVKTYYTGLPAFLSSPAISGLPVFGTFTEAPDIYSDPLSERGLIVLGNESHGISAELDKFITRKISIPLSGKG
jgi:RNA methyltransferase, TrmH family